MSGWHGWSKQLGGVKRASSLHIGMVPGRKSVCLYALVGSELRVLAYFRDHDAAVEAMRFIDVLTGLETEQPTTEKGQA